VKAMPNSFWFYLLIAISVFVFLFAFFKARQPYMFATFFVMSGLAFVLEYFVLIIGDGYQYYPEFIDNSFYDSLLGSLVSQALIIPVAAIVIAVFRMHILAIIIISIAFMLVESFFIYIKIYEQYWWKTIYTGMLLPFYFLFAKYWLSMLQKRKKGLVHFSTLFFYALSINSVILFFLVLVFQTHQLNIGWFSDPNRDHIAINTIYIVGLTAVFTLLVYFKKGVKWIAFIFSLFFILDYLLLKNDMLKIADWWSLAYFTLLNVVDILMIFVINNSIQKSDLTYR
jgi:hypothetical protein